MMDTNYLGTVYCTKVYLDFMFKRRSGHIVNVASLAPSFGVTCLAGYCAFKFAVLGFSEALHHELAGTGVHIMVVSPVGVRTEFFNKGSFEKTPNYTGFMLDAKTVSRAVLAAANSKTGNCRAFLHASRRVVQANTAIPSSAAGRGT